MKFYMVWEYLQCVCLWLSSEWFIRWTWWPIFKVLQQKFSNGFVLLELNLGFEQSFRTDYSFWIRKQKLLVENIKYVHLDFMS